MKKLVILCDGCKKMLPYNSDVFHIDIQSESDSLGLGNLPVRLDFCKSCALSIKKTLEKISKNYKEDENQGHE